MSWLKEQNIFGLREKKPTIAWNDFYLFSLLFEMRGHEKSTPSVRLFFAPVFQMLVALIFERPQQNYNVGI